MAKANELRKMLAANPKVDLKELSRLTKELKRLEADGIARPHYKLAPPGEYKRVTAGCGDDLARGGARLKEHR